MLVSALVCMHTTSQPVVYAYQCSSCCFVASFDVVCVDLPCSSYCSTTFKDMDLQGEQYGTGYSVLTALVSLAKDMVECVHVYC